MASDMRPVSPRDSDEFADLVDGIPRFADGVSPGRTTAGTVTSIDVLAGLGRLAVGLEAQATPDEQFRSRLRERLTATPTSAAAGAATAHPDGYAIEAGGRTTAAGTAGHVADVRDASTATAARRRRWRPAVALAGLAASVVAVGGVVVGSSHSLPGEPLYAIKRGTEALQVKAASGSLRQGERHLQLAEVRLREVKALATAGDTALGPVTGGHPLAAGGGAGADILDTLQDMDSETTDGKRLIVAAATASQDPRPLEQLLAWSAAQQLRIAEVLPGLPAAAQQRAQVSLTLTGEVKADAVWRIAQCSARCPATSAMPSQAPPSPAVPPLPAPSTKAPGQPRPAQSGQPPAPNPLGTDQGGSGGSGGSGKSDGSGGSGDGSGRSTPGPPTPPMPMPSPAPTQAAPSSQEPSPPGPSEPGPTPPGPSGPEPTQPEPTQPEPTQPEPSQPEPSHPGLTDPEPTPSADPATAETSPAQEPGPGAVGAELQPSPDPSQVQAQIATVGAGPTPGPT